MGLSGREQCDERLANVVRPAHGQPGHAPASHTGRAFAPERPRDAQGGGGGARAARRAGHLGSQRCCLLPCGTSHPRSAALCRSARGRRDEVGRRDRSRSASSRTRRLSGRVRRRGVLDTRAFSPGARKVLRLMQREAESLGYKDADLRHLLLALLEYEAGAMHYGLLPAGAGAAEGPTSGDAEPARQGLAHADGRTDGRGAPSAAAQDNPREGRRARRP